MLESSEVAKTHPRINHALAKQTEIEGLCGSQCPYPSNSRSDACRARRLRVAKTWTMGQLT